MEQPEYPAEPPEDLLETEEEALGLLMALAEPYLKEARRLRKEIEEMQQ